MMISLIFMLEDRLRPLQCPQSSPIIGFGTPIFCFLFLFVFFFFFFKKCIHQSLLYLMNQVFVPIQCLAPNTQNSNKKIEPIIRVQFDKTLTVKVLTLNPKAKVSIQQRWSSQTLMLLSEINLVVDRQDRFENILSTTYIAHVKWAVTDKKNLQKLV